MCSLAFSKIFLFVVNFIFWLAGIALLVVGILIRVDSSVVNLLEVIRIEDQSPLIDHVSLLFIVVGAVVFVVGFFGCCGAIRESQCLLFLYIALVFVIIIAEIAAAVLVIFYRSEVDTHLKSSMLKQLKSKYYNGTAKYDAYNFLQVKMQCCGVVDGKDFYHTEWWNRTHSVSGGTTQPEVPNSCCKVDDKDDPINLSACQAEARSSNPSGDNYSRQGCYSSIKNWFDEKSVIIMIVALAIAAIQIISIVAACTVRSSIKRHAHE